MLFEAETDDEEKTLSVQMSNSESEVESPKRKRIKLSWNLRSQKNKNKGNCRFFLELRHSLVVLQSHQEVILEGARIIMTLKNMLLALLMHKKRVSTGFLPTWSQNLTNKCRCGCHFR